MKTPAITNLNFKEKAKKINPNINKTTLTIKIHVGIANSGNIPFLFISVSSYKF